VLVTKSDCFGEAGCNVEYEISPVYVGAGPLTKQPFRVFYNILGGDSRSPIASPSPMAPTCNTTSRAF
jgi:hypothetical protein